MSEDSLIFTFLYLFEGSFFSWFMMAMDSWIQTSQLCLTAEGRHAVLGHLHLAHTGDSQGVTSNCHGIAEWAQIEELLLYSYLSICLLWIMGMIMVVYTYLYYIIIIIETLWTRKVEF